MWMAVQVLLPPEILNNYPAQRLSPESIGNTALLSVRITPDDGPTPPFCFACCFLCEARLANASLAHKHHTVRILRFERLRSTARSILFNARASYQGPFSSKQHLLQLAQLMLASHQGTLITPP